MIRLTILISALIICSCATGVKVVKISDSKKDAFSKESLFRYDDLRLSKISKNPEYKNIVKCYKDDLSGAVNSYKKQFLKENKKTSYWLHIGNCYYLNNQYSKAKFYYNFTVGIARGNDTLLAATYNNLAMIEIHFRNYGKALSFLKKSIKAKQTLLTPKFNISQIYLKFSLARKAIYYLNSILNRSNNNNEVVSSLATAHLLNNDPNFAIRYFKKIDKRSAKREDIAINYALALYKTGQYKKAKLILSESTGLGINELSKTKDILSDKIDKQLTLIEKAKENKTKIAEQVKNKKKG